MPNSGCCSLGGEQRIPHAMLFCGRRGFCGKMAVALAFASHLLGDGPCCANGNIPTFTSLPHGEAAFNVAGDRQPVSDALPKSGANVARGPISEPVDAGYGAANQQAIITTAERRIARKLSLKSSQGATDLHHLAARAHRSGQPTKLLKLLKNRRNRQCLSS